MKVLIDTNRYSDFARNVADVVELFAHAETIFVPFAVVAELRAGFRSGTLSRRNEVTLVKFLNNDRVSVLYPDDGTARTYAELYAELRANGATHEVGTASGEVTKGGNAWGLYDMHGNVYEWMFYNASSYSMMRGGNWNVTADKCASSYGEKKTKNIQSAYIGFRLFRNLP